MMEVVYVFMWLVMGVVGALCARVPKDPTEIADWVMWVVHWSIVTVSTFMLLMGIISTTYGEVTAWPFMIASAIVGTFACRNDHMMMHFLKRK